MSFIIGNMHYYIVDYIVKMKIGPNEQSIPLFHPWSYSVRGVLIRLHWHMEEEQDLESSQLEFVERGSNIAQARVMEDGLHHPPRHPQQRALG